MKHLFLLLGLLLDAAAVRSQSLCPGSLGDPVVNVTFGAGPNFGAPLPAGATTYKYKVGYPDDGWYTIANSMGPGWNDWHVTPDHTPGDQNGYALIVNASFAPGEFYRQTVGGLCENTYYEFSAWLLCLNKPSVTPCGSGLILPNIAFRVEDANGAVLGSVVTGAIPATESPLWRQYGFSFFTGPGQTSVRIVLVNNAPGGCGNDIALDDITFRTCGDQVQVLSAPNLASHRFCQPDSVRLSAELDGAVFATPVFQWQRSADGGISWTDIGGTVQTPELTVWVDQPDQLFRVLLANSASNLAQPGCRAASLPVLAQWGFPAPLSLTVDNGCGAESSAVDLEPPPFDPPYTYAWSHGAVSQDLVNLPDGTYTVTVTSAGGCTDTAQATVLAEPLPTLLVRPDTSIRLGQSVELWALSDQPVQWQPAAGLSCVNCPVALAAPAQTTQYTATARTPGGCLTSAQVTVEVDTAGCSLPLQIPNVFSPNDDGLHDYFAPYEEPEGDFLMQVYDRWGNLLFESRTARPGWDGTARGRAAPAGVYLYRVQLARCGSTVEGVGDVLLIR